MKNVTNDLMSEFFGLNQQSKDPLGEASKAIKRITLLEEQLKNANKRVTTLEGVLDDYIDTKLLNNRVGRILSMLERLEAQCSITKEDIRSLRVQVQNLKGDN